MEKYPCHIEIECGKETKFVYGLTDEQAAQYQIIGKAVAPDMELCLYEGFRHTPEFFHRLFGFRYRPADREARMFSEASGRRFIAVEFYETPDSLQK